jgi:transposase
MVRALYTVEKHARDLSDAAWPELRQDRSAPESAGLREKLLELTEQLLPKHPMAEAINYALGQCTAQVVFCSDGAVPIDNNVSE